MFFFNQNPQNSLNIIMPENKKKCLQNLLLYISSGKGCVYGAAGSTAVRPMHSSAAVGGGGAVGAHLFLGDPPRSPHSTAVAGAGQDVEEPCLPGGIDDAGGLTAVSVPLRLTPRDSHSCLPRTSLPPSPPYNH